MKNTMCGLIAILLAVMTFAGARSLPTGYTDGKQQTTASHWKVARREADSAGHTTNKTDPMTNNFFEELNNLSMPGYLKDLFINLTRSNEIKDLPENAKVNTIRSYENQAKNIGCGHYKFHMKKHELDEEDVIRAELHLLQKSSTTIDSSYDVEIYYLPNKKVHESMLKFTFQQVDSTPGWKTFDVTPIVLSWKQGLVNHGLQIRLIKGGKRVSCEGVFSEGEQNSLEKPSLVVFTHDHSSEDELKKIKPSHTITQQNRRRRDSDATDTPTTNTATVQNKKCHLKEMKVTAESLSAGNIHVIFPKEINVKKCDGHCTKIDPKALQKNTITNHSDLLSIYYYKTVGIKDAPSRCCRATSFNMVPMIFYDETVKEKIIKVTVPVQAAACSCL